MFNFVYLSPIGYLKIVEENGFIVEVSTDYQNLIYPLRKTELISQAIQELEEYFNNKRITFTIPVQLRGTDFEKLVYQKLMIIPYGKTISYQELAMQVGNEKALRAVGRANGKNRLLIIVPCHRVINKNGKLGGFSAGLEKKQYLLELETFQGSSNER